MRLIRSLLGIVVLAGIAAAQSAAPKAAPAQRTPAAAKPAAAKNVTAEAPKAAVLQASAPASTVSGKLAVAKTHEAAKPRAAKAVKAASAHTAEQAADKDKVTAAMRGKRDPFISIIRNRELPYPTCASGKGCLIVDQLVLKGVVKSPTGMLAVVVNGQHKAYFLRENDPVFNGQVVKITGDSIIFKEKVINRAGRESEREVVKRMAKPA